MSQLLGVAFSSPAVVPLLIDNTNFLVHVYNGDKSAYTDYLAVQDARKKVVLVSTVRRLLQAQELDTPNNVAVFMLFDRTEILDKISGCSIIDGVQDNINPGTWNILQEKITIEKLNSILEEASAQDVPFEVPENVEYQASLLEPSLFDFIGQVLSSIPKEPLPKDEEDEEDDDFVYEPNAFAETFKKETVAWVCGIYHARRWIIRYKKRLVSLGADEELTLDLYRFCHEGLSAKKLWLAYHGALRGMTLEDAAIQYEAHPGDLQKCVEAFPLDKKRTYKRVPEEEKEKDE